MDAIGIDALNIWISHLEDGEPSSIYIDSQNHFPLIPNEKDREEGLEKNLYREGTEKEALIWLQQLCKNQKRYGHEEDYQAARELLTRLQKYTLYSPNRREGRVSRAVQDIFHIKSIKSSRCKKKARELIKERCIKATFLYDEYLNKNLTPQLALKEFLHAFQMCEAAESQEFVLNKLNDLLFQTPKEKAFSYFLLESLSGLKGALPRNVQSIMEVNDSYFIHTKNYSAFKKEIDSIVERFNTYAETSSLAKVRTEIQRLILIYYLIDNLDEGLKTVNKLASSITNKIGKNRDVRKKWAREVKGLSRVPDCVIEEADKLKLSFPKVKMGKKGKK